MNAAASSRLLPPETLAGLANLELIARTAVEGFLTGLHRSPHYGFSQEFKEYRAYVEGDDPRFVDWNVYARTERTYIRRYEGETNTRLMILLDASASMGYGSRSITKLQYAKFLAAALAYLAARQHDPVGLIVFDEKVRNYRPATSRAGSLNAMIHAIDAVTPGNGTDLEACFQRFGEHLSRRGLVRCDLRSVLRSRGHEQSGAAAGLSWPRHHVCSSCSIRRRCARTGVSRCCSKDIETRANPSMCRRSIWRASISSAWTRICNRCGARPPTSARISC